MLSSTDKIIETDRLILRKWHVNDAESLYKYAKDLRVGPAAGWPPHTSVENSRAIIRDVLSAPETYAVVLKETNEPIGSIGLKQGEYTSLTDQPDEGEIGYWLGVPHWGQGYIPEAVNALITYAFETLKLQTIWCGYFSHNTKSQTVQKKCGFKFHHTNYNTYFPLIDATYDECVTQLTRQRWMEIK